MVCRWILLLAAWLCWAPAAAAPADGGLSFQRRSWTQAEGAPTAVWKIAQSDDGLLWFATGNGLYRYDGERFQRVDTVYGHRLRSNNIVEVEAVGGGIAVGYQFGGMSILTSRAARDYGDADGLPPGTVRVITKAPDGLLYVGTQRAMAVFDGKSWRRLPGKSLPEGVINSVVIDRDQTLWVTVDWNVYSRARGDTDFTLAFAVPYGAVPNLVLGKLSAEIGLKSALAEVGKPPVFLQVPAKKRKNARTVGRAVRHALGLGRRRRGLVPAARRQGRQADGGAVVRGRRQPGASGDTDLCRPRKQLLGGDRERHRALSGPAYPRGRRAARLDVLLRAARTGR